MSRLVRSIPPSITAKLTPNHICIEPKPQANLSLELGSFAVYDSFAQPQKNLIIGFLETGLVISSHSK